MFDRMIESNSSEAAGSKPRRSYFLLSAGMLTVMFLTAVVLSLYAQDFSLGTDNFDLVELVAPIAPQAPEPEPPRERNSDRSPSTSHIPHRQANILRMDESPKTPSTISTAPNTARERPDGKYLIGPSDTPAGPPTDGTLRDHPVGTGSREVDADGDESVRVAMTTPPPPIRVVAKPVSPPTKSLGVINGKAISLPKPQYPVPAQAMGVQGAVNVQVSLDETGKVVSSRAVSGHPFLRASAEKAAWSARFSPTVLSNVPVKVTGVIIYNFTR